MARIGITIGDVAGIGPEIVVQAVSELRKEPYNLTLIGSASVLSAMTVMLKTQAPLPKVIDTGDVDFEFGKIADISGKAALSAIDKSIELAKKGEIDALVTAPVNKQAVGMAYPGFTGHTEYLADAFGARDVLMIAHSPYISFAFITTHLPLSRVSAVITSQVVERKIELYHEYLSTLHDRDVTIAVLALNPHAEEFTCGEEARMCDAIEFSRKKGLDVLGPIPADTFHLYAEKVDGFLAAYHDQGMIPAKMLARGQGVNVTWGLGFVRTSPLHGTAFDIAGKGLADSAGMVSAIRLADTLMRS